MSYDVGLAHYHQAFRRGRRSDRQTFPPAYQRFYRLFDQCRQRGRGVIFSPTSTEFAAQIITQAAANGIKIPILAGDTWDSSVILNAAKGTDVSVSVSTFFDEGDSSSKAAEFVTGFKAWLNENPDKLANNGGNDIVAAVSALGYDGYMVALEALKLADSAERDDIAEVMADVTFDGVTGSIVFGENGDAVRDQAFIIRSDNELSAWQFLKVQTVSD